MRSLTFLFLLISSIGYAQTTNTSYCDCLEPVPSIYDLRDDSYEYHSRVRKILYNGLSEYPEIRYQVLPSFIPEHLVVIEYDDKEERYYLIFRMAEEMIWYNESWKKLKYTEYKKTIDSNSVRLIKSLFKAAILKARYTENKRLGNDGAMLLYSVYLDGMKSGQVWSPPEGTLMRRLDNIVYNLIVLAKGPGIRPVEFDKQFIEKIEKLKADLQ